MIWSISLKIRTYLSCITIDIKQTVLSVHYPLPVFEKVSLYGHVSTFRYSGSGFMRLWASGTFSDDSRSVTWSSVTARRCHWRCVAASATAQTHCVTGCVLVKMERSELEICVALVVLICVRFIYLYMLLGVCLWLALVCMSVWVGVLMWWCSDVQDECRSLLCLSLHLWLWQSLHPPRSCCHMLPASVSAEQKA